MPISTGIDNETGAPLSDLDHVRQSFETIVTTPYGSRVTKRTFGVLVPRLLGRPLVPLTLAVFVQAVGLACYLWEPRLRVIGALYPAPPNTTAMLRFGGIALTIRALYRPYALQGDLTTGARIIDL